MNTSLNKVLEQKGKQVYVTSPVQSVLDAIKTMQDRKVGALLVVEDGKPVGIFTERDVMTRVVSREFNPAETSVSEVMTKNLVAVCPDTTVQQAMAIVTEKRCRHLPVMDGDELLGVVSSGDLMHWVVKSQGYEIENLVRYITGQYPA
ncbi:CBS domain-containing protein [Gemmatimonadota bacterium]